MAIKWIVLVTRTEARMFSEKTFRPLAELKNDLGREKNRVMTTEKPGMARNNLGTPFSTHSLTGEKDPHEAVALAFAKKVSGFLDKQWKLGHFDDLLLIAEPRMAGRLRNEMDAKLMDRAQWLTKDLGKVAVHELPKIIAASGF